MKCYIGIDPGVSGGYAIAFDDLTVFNCTLGVMSANLYIT